MTLRTNVELKDYIKSKSEFLKNNDLIGMYQSMNEDAQVNWYNDFGFYYQDIGKVTTVLEQCGIDTVSSFTDGVIPSYYCYQATIPESFIFKNPVVDTCIHFPPHIEHIHPFAFENAVPPVRCDILDLRGIKTVGKTAFKRLPVMVIMIDEGLEKVDEYAFLGCHIKYIYAPTSMKEEEVKSLFDDGLTLDEVKVEFY